MERTKEEIVEQINHIVENSIQPSVAMHGGEVKLQDFDVETGEALMLMSGACSGCAASSQTLKMGVENMLKHYVPEVNRVTGMDDPKFNDPYYKPAYETWQEEEFFEKPQDYDIDDTGKNQ